MPGSPATNPTTRPSASSSTSSLLSASFTGPFCCSATGGSAVRSGSDEVSVVASCALAKDTRAKSRAMIASRGSSLVNWCCSPRKLLLSQPPPTRSPDDLSLRWRRCTGLVSTASVLNPYAHWDSQAYGPPRVHAPGRPGRFSVLTRGIAFERRVARLWEMGFSTHALLCIGGGVCTQATTP